MHGRFPIFRGRAPGLPLPQVYAYGRASSSRAKFTWLMVGQDFWNRSKQSYVWPQEHPVHVKHDA